ncbi:unnamed protein product [Blepharisma stoltei]|uniref:UBC core domain-containing protein n=1 Tax=Blepharisma stoltei TaxID=1481888 RepID=A0AAU9KA16_9CILI|nr:unnamed protein product [Blepharisma stoltei]
MIALEEYTEELQQKRIEKENSLLEPSISGLTLTRNSTKFGLAIQVDFKNTIGSSTSISFKIHLEGKYPFQPPRITCETIYGYPSISDGRDLLDNILKKQWTPNTTVVEIINCLKSFISELAHNPSIRPGSFKLGTAMSLDSWDNKRDMKCFRCIELDPQNPKFTRDRALVITHTHILQLELNSLYEGVGHLVCWSSLQLLSAVKKGRSDPDRLIFEWKPINNNPQLAQQFKVKDHDALIEVISENLKKLGGSVKRHVVQEVPKIKEEEVNASSLKKIKIKDILKAIANLEKETAVVMNYKNVHALIDYYQKAIEYYSALSDEKFEEYIQKLQKLFSNEKVLAILNSPEPKAEETKSGKRPRVKDEPVELQSAPENFGDKWPSSEVINEKTTEETKTTFEDSGDKWPTEEKIHEVEEKIHIEDYGEKWPSEEEIKEKRTEGINELLQQLERELNDNDEDEYDENMVNEILETEITAGVKNVKIDEESNENKEKTSSETENTNEGAGKENEESKEGIAEAGEQNTVSQEMSLETNVEEEPNVIQNAESGVEKEIIEDSKNEELN